MKKVYLDKIDINESAQLTLSFKNKSFDSYLIYFISYGLIADQVLMQGSAPMKSETVQRVFKSLQDSFMRDESHNDSNPIYSFTLAEDTEGYFDYLKARIDKLKLSSENAETESYKNNHGLEAATNLDKELKFIVVPKRKESVGKIFKKSVLVDIQGIELKNEQGERFKEKAVSIANDMEIFQSFEFMKALNLDSKRNKKFYDLIRKNYLSSNALASEAKCTFNSMHFKWETIFKFLSLIGVMKYLVKNTDNGSSFLFHLRLTKSLSQLKDIYYKCQSEEEIQTLLQRIEKIKKHGKYKSLIKESPSALISFFFTSLNENDIGFKSINKVGEKLVNATMDTHMPKDLFALISALEEIEIDLKFIHKKLSVS